MYKLKLLFEPYYYHVFGLKIALLKMDFSGKQKI